MLNAAGKETRGGQAKEGEKRKEGELMDLGDSDSSEDNLPSLKGAKGALALEVLRQERVRKPIAISKAARGKASIGELLQAVEVS